MFAFSIPSASVSSTHLCFPQAAPARGSFLSPRSSTTPSKPDMSSKYLCNIRFQTQYEPKLSNWAFTYSLRTFQGCCLHISWRFPILWHSGTNHTYAQKFAVGLGLVGLFIFLVFSQVALGYFLHLTAIRKILSLSSSFWELEEVKHFWDIFVRHPPAVSRHVSQETILE